MDRQNSLIERASIPKITASQVLSERKVIEELSQARNKERNARDDETRHLQWEVYYHKIKQVEAERDNAIAAIQTTRDKAIAEKDKEVAAHQSIIEQAKRILEMLRVQESKPLNISEDQVTTRDGTVESLGDLIDDEYLKIKLFIVTNDKPKNKYSLIAVGRSIFDEPVIKHPYDYGVNLRDWQRTFNILRILKDAHIPEVLKDWLTKRKDLASELTADYQRVKQEYVAIKQLYKADDFKELITWTCPQCNNFRTILDYSEPEPQCYRHDPHVNMTERR